VPDGAKQWCISWKCWIPCFFHNEVVWDCAVVVNSWLLYFGGWIPKMRWGRQLELNNFCVRVESPSCGFINSLYNSGSLILCSVKQARIVCCTSGYEMRPVHHPTHAKPQSLQKKGTISTYETKPSQEIGTYNRTSLGTTCNSLDLHCDVMNVNVDLN
jgi:hypothetical protein